MARKWLGFDATRLVVLRRQTVAAAEELNELVGDEPSGSDAAAVVTTIVAGMRYDWMPLLDRITVDTTLTSWSSSATIASASLPGPPAGGAAVVARWWEELPPFQQYSVIAFTPWAIGGLDGVPAWARDRANRVLLASDLGHLAARQAGGQLTDVDAAVLANARAVESALVEGEAFVDPRTGTTVGVQLYLYEPTAFAGDGAAALVLGDLDTADHAAIAVPGMGTEVAQISTTTPEVVYAAASAHTSDSIAAMTWVGYDAPSIAVVDGTDDNPIDDATDWVGEAGDLAHVVTIGPAARGAAILAADVEGVRVMHRDDEVHVTVIGNSYGSTTVAIAADELALDADDVVLTGSPGAGQADRATDLTTGAANTWVGSASDDPLSYLGRTGGAEPHDLVDLAGPAVGLGHDPAEDDFGAQRFQAEWSGRHDDAPWSFAGHAHYFDPCAEAPASIGAIVAGEYDAVRLAEARQKDESWDLWDPLADLVASDPEADQPVDGAACPPGESG